jgi:hypothetical protein
MRVEVSAPVQLQTEYTEKLFQALLCRRGFDPITCSGLRLIEEAACLRARRCTATVRERSLHCYRKELIAVDWA